MAIQQTQTWRIREAINKKIERQLQEGITPLTKYKTFFPFESGGDIIDRRTGKIKTLETVIREQTTPKVGTIKQFAYWNRSKDWSEKQLKREYNARVNKYVPEIKRMYEEKVTILAEMDITSTRQAREYQKARLDEVRANFVMSFNPNSEKYYETIMKIETMSDDDFLSYVREANKRTYAGKGPKTASFYKTLAEIMNLPEIPEPPSP